MSITRDEFIPRPGIVNKQGHLPDPSELVCIEVPKVFDQCLIKRCLVYYDGPDTDATDEELRSNPLNNPRIYTGSRNFELKLTSVEKIPLTRNPSYKKVIVSFVISFYADFIDSTNGQTQSEFYEINRTEVISKLYCPDSIAQISASFVPTGISRDLDSEIIKLEMVAEALDGTFTRNDDCTFLDITLGFHLIVKCELIVQLLIPAYGFCPVPKQCEEEPEEDACEKFERAPVPKFFPDQKLEPLFENDYDYTDEDED